GDSENAREFEEGFRAVWLGKAESDHLNTLITRAGLPWQHILILRALGRYAHQVSSTHAFTYTETALVRNPIMAAVIVDLFGIRFNPERDADAQAREREAEERASGLLKKLENVRSADDDRALRMLI